MGHPERFGLARRVQRIAVEDEGRGLHPLRHRQRRHAAPVRLAPDGPATGVPDGIPGGLVALPVAGHALLGGRRRGPAGLAVREVEPHHRVAESGEALRQRLQPGPVDIAAGAVRERDGQLPFIRALEGALGPFIRALEGALAVRSRTWIDD